MLKKVKLDPNQRLDKEDVELIQSQGQDHTSANNQHLIVSNKPVVISGFKVQISDQTTSPGEFTIFNGTAIDGQGRLVTNHSDSNASRSITLSGNATYYVEVQYVENASDNAKRAYWDPTYDNGTDPSGDIRVPGTEVTTTVATRYSLDWEVVEPVSTSGFAYTSDPDTVKIPVAILVVSGGQITTFTNPLEDVSTVVLETVTVGDNTVKVVDSKGFPNTFTGTVGVETVTVTGNDTDNNVLTISGTFGSNHSQGEKVVITSTYDNFLPPAPVTASGSRDSRNLLFSGNETRGDGLKQRGVGSSYTDSNISNVDEYVDFISSQLLELKFGSGKPTEAGKTAPPTAYAPSSLRYFDNAGSLLGARTNTISMGDGSTSWGDFNVDKYADAPACLTAALTALPSSGGVLFIKKGTYNFPTTVTVPSGKLVAICGEGRGVTILQASSTNAVLSVTGSLILSNLTVSSGGSAYGSINTSGATASVVARDCLIYGLYSLSTGITKSYFENCSFLAGSSSHAVEGSLHKTTFTNCDFTFTASAATKRAVRFVPSANSGLVNFNNCVFAVTSADAGVEVEVTGSSLDSAGPVEFNNCQFSASTKGINTINTGGTVSGLKVKNCTSTCTGGLLYTNGTHSKITVANNSISAAAVNAGVYFDGAVSNTLVNHNYFLNCENAVYFESTSTDVIISHNIIENTTAGVGTNGIKLQDAGTRVIISSNNIKGLENSIVSNPLCGIYVADGTHVDILDNIIYDINDSTTEPVVGIFCNNLPQKSKICRNQVRDITNAGAGVSGGIYVADCNVGSTVITDNIIYLVDSSSSGNCYGIGLIDTGGLDNAIINNNSIESIGGSTTGLVHGIYTPSVTDVVISNNDIKNIGSSSCTGSNGIISSGAASQISRLKILGNSLRGISSNNANSCDGIVVTVSGATNLNNVDICNNTVTNSSVSNGTSRELIKVYAPDSSSIVRNIKVDGNILELGSDGIFIIGSGTTFENISVNNNIIRGIQYWSINISTSCTTAKEVVINNNTINNQTSSPLIDGFDNTASGIQVYGADSSNKIKNVVINGNNIYLNVTSISSASKYQRGIYTHYCKNGTITGNSVNIETDTANEPRRRALNTEYCDNFVLNSNNLKVIHNSNLDGSVSYGLRVDNSTNTTIISNMVFTENTYNPGTPTTNAVGIYGASTNTNTVTFSNIIIGFTGSSNSAFEINGTAPVTTAKDIDDINTSDGNWNDAPSAVSDVTTNITFND